MGQTCDGQGRTQSSLTFSNFYLTNPHNLTKTQIRKSGSNKMPDLTNSFLGLDTALILGCKSGQNKQLLNKYVLTYLYFIKNLPAGEFDAEVKDFVNLLQILDEDKQYQKQIADFQAQYPKLQGKIKQRRDFLINEYFKNGFFSSAIQKFPIYSSDPSILGYARRPMVDMSKAIKQRSQKQSRKKQIYCVIQVQKEEQEILKKIANNEDFFTFSTFVRCFSNEQRAKKRQRELDKIGKDVRESHSIQSTTLFLNIQIPNEEVDKDYDYGFYVDQTQKNNPHGDIIMNIVNFFQVTGAQPENKTYDLKYNALARLIHLRRQRLLQSEPQLLKITSMISGQLQEIRSHSNLIRVAADRGISITASQTLKKSYGVKENVEDRERINLIEAYLEQRNFDNALQQCKGKNTDQFKVRRAQILYESGKTADAQTLLREVQPSKQALKNNKDTFKEYVLLEYMLAKINKSKGQTKQAKKRLVSLTESMKKQYKAAYEYRGRQVERELQQTLGATDPGVNWEKFADGLNINPMLSH